MYICYIHAHVEFVDCDYIGPEYMNKNAVNKERSTGRENGTGEVWSRNQETRIEFEENTDVRADGAVS